MLMCGHRGCNACFEDAKNKHTGPGPVMCPVGGEDCTSIMQVLHCQMLNFMKFKNKFDASLKIRIEMHYSYEEKKHLYRKNISMCSKSL